MTTVPLVEHGGGRAGFREVAQDTEKTIGFISESPDFLASGSDNYLTDYYFSWLKSCLLVGACWHPLLNTLRAILKNACCTASSPSNLKLSLPGNRSVTAQSRNSSSGNSVLFLTAEFWPEAFSAFVANPAGTTDWLLFPVKEGFGVRPVLGGAWRTPRRIWSTAYFRSSRYDSGSYPCPSRYATAWPTTRVLPAMS